MKIENYISKAKFDLISREYISRTELPLILVNLEGKMICKTGECELCKKLNIYERIAENCRPQRAKAIEESLRWGESYISTCPLGLIIFSVPITRNNELLGGLISGFAIFPEMKSDINEEILWNLKKYNIPFSDSKKGILKLKTVSLRDTRKYAAFLLKLTRKYDINDTDFLIERKEKYIQQYHIANFLDYVKKEKNDVPRMILEKQDEIIEKVILGDKSGAIEILNQFLGSIFFDSGMKFEILKVRLIELIVIISRAAIESGVNSRELFGLNFSYLTELNKADNIEDLCYKITKILENFMNKVSTQKARKKKIEVHKMEEYIKQNFTGKIRAEDIAKASNLSVSRALHLFKEETVISLTDYIKKLRIKYSKYLLLNTEMGIAEIANKSGFFDQSHFTRNFKKFEKITPSQFKKKYQT